MNFIREYKKIKPNVTCFELLESVFTLFDMIDDGLLKESIVLKSINKNDLFELYSQVIREALPLIQLAKADALEAGIILNKFKLGRATAKQAEEAKRKLQSALKIIGKEEGSELRNVKNKVINIASRIKDKSNIIHNTAA